MANNFSYYQQSAPFWDFIASLEEQGNNHPFFARGNQQNEASGANEQQQQQPPNPWANNGFGGFPFGGMPHRGRHGPHGRQEHRGPPPPPIADYDMSDEPTQHEPEAGPSESRDPPTSSIHNESHSGPGAHRRPHSHHNRGPRGRCGGRGRGGFGGFGGRGHPFGNPAFGAMGGLGELANMFQSQLFGDNAGENQTKDVPTESKSEDFKPEVDVFDTAESYVVHISLPGAKKEDVGVNWDAEKSELSIAGVIYRPGDEELLKTLALDEPQVDSDAISAKLEDGVLRVDVPKQDAEYVEIKKVDIE
ncbi:hypothetical protein LTR56_004059 [Elasticomyces elasticus]|nr:hypothetical protein LTR56_004059 [Elasticomyces elasticus]KAK3661377.1 hypothetical protein LTR22_007584 [Elasticomyces elasticus]KAK4928927.1 hypothetical protein LTR49_004428 [Elasticomyces elasticus]KAK5765407.1 hypothetical protein LTS12_004420 [Elasticomyces elasticus]